MGGSVWGWPAVTLTPERITEIAALTNLAHSWLSSIEERPGIDQHQRLRDDLVRFAAKELPVLLSEREQHLKALRIADEGLATISASRDFLPSGEWAKRAAKDTLFRLRAALRSDNGPGKDTET